MVNFYRLRYILCILFFYYANIIASSIIPGPSAVYLQNDHLVLYDTEKVQGFVRLNNGFTIVNSGMATFDTFITVSGVIDMRDTGQLQLLSDLLLDSGVTLSSGGKIRGHGRSIVLNGNLTIPANKTLQITGDTIIEGNGNTIILDSRAQLFIDNNITLTLKNMTLKTTNNPLLFPAINLWGHASKLALDNVIIAPKNDIYIRDGQLFIHNDVLFTGTSSLIYQSSQSSYIASQSSLIFDLETTFSFEPVASSKDLLVLQDQSSNIYLNGCSLQTTMTGCRLTKGRLLLDNHVNLALPRSYAINGFSGTSFTKAWFEAGDSGGSTSPNDLCLDFNPANSQYFSAIGRYGYMVKLYTFNGSTITRVFREAWPTFFGAYGPRACAWQPQGDYLAVVGQQYLKIYQFTGGTLVGLAPVDVGGAASYQIQSVAWSPDGAYLAIGTPNDVQVYSFNAGTTTLLYTLSSTWGLTWGLSWRNVSGYYLATCGANGTCNIYSWNNNTLSFIASPTDLLTQTIFSASWSADGKFLAIGLDGEFRLYEWSEGSLTQINNSYPTVGGQVGGVDCFWDNGGKYIAVGVSIPTVANTDTQIWKFENGSLFPVSTIGCGGGSVNMISWSTDHNYIASATRGVSNAQIQIYPLSYTANIPPSTGGIVFGNSSLGSEYDLDVHVLGGAQVEINGKVNHDPA